MIPATQTARDHGRQEHRPAKRTHILKTACCAHYHCNKLIITTLLQPFRCDLQPPNTKDHRTAHAATMPTAAAPPAHRDLQTRLTKQNFSSKTVEPATQCGLLKRMKKAYPNRRTNNLPSRDPSHSHTHQMLQNTACGTSYNKLLAPLHCSQTLPNINHIQNRSLVQVRSEVHPHFRNR